MSGAQERVIELQVRISDLLAEREALKERVEEAEALYISTRDERDALSADVRNLQNSQASWDRLTQLHQTISALEGRAIKAETQAQETQEAVGKLRFDLTMHENACKALIERITKARQILHGSAVKSDAVKNALQVLEGEDDGE